MNTNEEYNKHLQEFYAATFREYAFKNGIGKKSYGPDSSESQKYADEMLFSYGAAINQGMAYELLNKIEMNSPTHLQKLENYPSMFWQTKNGKDVLENISKELIKNQTTFLFDKESLTAENISESWKIIVDFAKKIALKESGTGASMVQIFTSEFIDVLKAKNEQSMLEDKESLHLGYMNALEALTNSKTDFKIPAFFALESHLNALKAHEKHNASIMSIGPHNKMKM